MPGKIEEDPAQLDLWGGPGSQTNPIPLEEDRGRLPSGHHPDEPFDQVGSVWESDLPPRVSKAAKKILPRDRDRQRCVEELESTAANRGLTYRQVLEAYAECVSGLAKAGESGPQAGPKGSLVPPEALIERMRQALDALVLHYPLDCRIEHAPGDDVTITSPEDVAEYFRPAIAHLPQEQLRVLWLDTRNQIIGQHMAHQGDHNSSLVRAADVFRQPMAAGASSIILSHNHPSGDPDPSPQDVKITKELKEVADQLGIELLDHVVIGRGGNGRYVSLAERNHLPTRQRSYKMDDPPGPFEITSPAGPGEPFEGRVGGTPRRDQREGAIAPLEKPDLTHGSVKPLCAAAETKTTQADRPRRPARTRTASTGGPKQARPTPRVPAAAKSGRPGHPMAGHPLALLGRRKHGVR